jgi:putative ABC transport system permease protein
VIDRERGPLTLPREGLALSSALGALLGIQRGDRVTVEVLEGARPVRQVVVAELIDDFLGLSAYMEADALAALMREDSSLSGAFLSVDPAQEQPLFAALKHTPDVAGVAMNRAAVISFRETIRANMMRIILFNVLFSGVIAIGVVYNAARISLSERSRDLASLRVLGFSSYEISLILLGELAAVTLVAIPIGIVCGRGLASLTLALLDNELYRIPLIIDPSTYANSVLVVLLASLLSGMLVQQRLKRLDLVGVLKTSE